MYPQLATQPSPAPRGVITADVVSDAAGFDALLVEWDALLASSRTPVPFMKAGWFDCWRRFAMNGNTFNIIAARERGSLVALAPLMRVRRGFGFSDRLEFLATGPAGSDYLDLIVRDGAGDDAVGAIAAAIHAQQAPLYLDHLPPHSNAARLSGELERIGWTSLESSPDVCPFIDLTGLTWDDFLETLGPAHRANIRRRIRALDSTGVMTFTRVETHQQRREALDRLIRFSEQRWTSRGGTSAFPTPSMIAFHQAVTRRALSEGWLRCYTLALDGDIAAVMYGFVVDDRFYFYQHGFDEARARYSLGLVLMALTIRASIDEGLREFDMLYGHEAYKQLWARQQRPLHRLELFPPRVTGTLLRRQAEARRALRLVAHQFGLKARHDHS